MLLIFCGYYCSEYLEMADRMKQLEEENRKLQYQIQCRQQLDKELFILKEKEKERKKQVRLQKHELKIKYNIN